MGSSRLPGKVMMKIDENEYVLDFVINQIKKSKSIDEIIVATTDLTEDVKIVEHLQNIGIKYFCGNSNDVLDRYFQCAKKFSCTTIVRITADNPLIDPNIIDKTIEVYENKEFDLVTNTINRTFPYGTEVEVFSFDSLEKSWNNAKKPSEREHVTPFIRNPENKFLLTNIKNEEDFSFLRYTVDRSEDLKLVKEIIKNIPTRPILLKDIITLYKNNSKIFDINKNIKHDGYLSSIEKDEQYFKSKNNERT
jgi:spore coat polysaccharide biosynthesis protein SpsF